MSSISTRYGKSSEFDSFAVSLHQCLKRHEQALEDEGLGKEVRELSRWIERAYGGSLTALEALEQHGPRDLIELKDRVILALEEQQRIAEESPAVNRRKDKEQQKYADALHDVSEALDQLIKVVTPANIEAKKGDQGMKLVTPVKDGQPTDGSIGEESRAKVAEALSGMLASTYSLYVKSLFYHWNVTGPHFHGLHQLFEEHYQDLHEAGDDIAERIRAIGHFTPGTLKAFGKLSKVEDDDELPNSAEDMLRNLKTAHGVCASEARKVLNVAEEVGDEVTADLMVERMRFHDEASWMLGASL
ncbi:Dps family protein [Kordiimonas gwangyangensis]|uniref:Dps family protein n=1 Tax=Kordiimonas gwangyangensis TaxID=288022 RepID=UPI0003794791|nr:DNA starvation/stationary phase protection protein [Kordiimonas gwangyangensis]